VLESSNRLGSMGALPHIAGVAGDDEPEQVLSLLQTLVAEIPVLDSSCGSVLLVARYRFCRVRRPCPEK
ncbi:hypothetical protein, partial [Nocardia cyriacigeorgica]